MGVKDDNIDDDSQEIDNFESEYMLAREKARTIKIKNDFIEDIKTGLGDTIKANPNSYRIIKKPWYTKIGLIIKKIFNKI